jgi:glycosyltransferase involved in cell wall biosynthesis
MARICMVAYTHYPSDSRVRREAEALVDRGDSVDVIVLRQKGEERVRILNGVRLIQLSVVRYHGSSAGMYLVNYFLFFISASISLITLHLKNNYQIIQVHTMPDFMVFVAMVPKFLGAKVILDVHDLMPELYQSKFGFGQTHWLIRLITWMELYSIGFADRAIAVHKPHLDALIRHGNPVGKFIILLNLPDPKIFANRARVSSRNDSSLKLIYHGTVAERHGLRVALRALTSLREEIKGLKFQIIGAGDDFPSLIDLAKELGLTDYVDFKTFMPLEELIPIILDADVGIVPILYDDFTKYMLPTKLLEYVALGKPVICSRTATIEAYFDDSMVEYSTPGDVAELAEHIRVLYRNPDKRDRLRTNADKFNREYNWEQQKQLYYELIDALIRKD